MMLEIKDLWVRVEGKLLLNGINLKINPGEVHTIMGPNGAGKSTLAKALAGHPSYEILRGEVEFMGKNLLSLKPEERAHAGLFISFQYPIEIPGVNNLQFLHTSYNSIQEAQHKEKKSQDEFKILLEEKMKIMEINPEFIDRNLNEGFSGGEKKRNEILQMAILKPNLAILDETDSGLDIDALKSVANGINRMMNKNMGILLITHYQRLLDYVKPHFVHVMCEGKIVVSGGPELAQKLEEKGYDWLKTSSQGEIK